ncbi:glycogen/starch/alpha-glucan family phosphorylase [Granulicatella elegans]|uniref:Alpha-1,4 glucan phosphorylase n=1 Tax=Granulicatella elegans ATCC 700633 TaxID=626369 RepID=D0BMZ8_9LACT|nr:glycogen/starch/alpha-glucan phosphorylase [Granulicatella elegans]EEW92488.1 maltodextrin phosphorylase [Granulicatella elegans ATCC 700633]
MQTLKQYVESNYHKSLGECSKEEVYVALLHYTKEKSAALPLNEGKKKVYYISAEFLIGKLLSNNLINLGIYDEVKEELEAEGHTLAEIEEIELEPSLGNGGLGRLAACFLDSIATLGLAGDGVGLNYHFGLFEQKFKDNQQNAVPNNWLTPDSWLVPTSVSYEVPFANFTLKSKMFNIDVLGYEQSHKNQLHLFDVDTIDESLVHDDSIAFDKTKIAENLTLFLYPDDSDEQGELLRIYQQYFMVSNGAQLLLDEAVAKGSNLHDLAEYATVQINDTHPSMVIPELIRLLGERGIEFDEAVEIVRSMTAYTNHTILAEALEKWPLHYLEQVVPHLVPIIKELDARVRAQFDDASVAIIDEHNRVHMANMDIHYGYSVNGVAALHTEILKQSELKNFYEIYPEKFNNKTNGITFRRWLLHANPELAKLLDRTIGKEYRHDATKLEALKAHTHDLEFQEALKGIKRNNKLRLKHFLQEHQGVTVKEDSIFDVQIKRMHEYKRQQMNALYVIYKYLDIKNGNIPAKPITIIFGGKAAPAYVIAQDIIHLILCLSELIANDPEVSPHLQVVMVENYNVTAATHLIPAADISEQISLASKEASGTGNMKFMLNGALTLGTLDGANVEIHELVGDENIYVFGEDSDTVIKHYENSDYHSHSYYEREAIRPLVDFIVSDALVSLGNRERLERLFNELINKDWFMTLLDLEDYIQTKERMLVDYHDRENWIAKVITNIAMAGFFSSDRTIEDYNRDIWKLN